MVLGTVEIVLLAVFVPLGLFLLLCCVCWPCYACFFGKCFIIEGWGGYDDGNIYDSWDQGIQCGVPMSKYEEGEAKKFVSIMC